jgi:hypothetical protein
VDNWLFATGYLLLATGDWLNRFGEIQKKPVTRSQMPAACGLRPGTAIEIYETTHRVNVRLFIIFYVPAGEFSRYLAHGKVGN